MTLKTISASNFRNNFGAISKEIESGNVIEVKNRGKSFGAFIDIDLLEDFLAAQDPEHIATVKKAREALKKKQTIPYDDVFAELGIGD